jgi:hypothetical protein
MIQISGLGGPKHSSYQTLIFILPTLLLFAQCFTFIGAEIAWYVQ